MNTFDNSEPDDQGKPHPLLAMDRALNEYILYLSAHEDSIKDLTARRAFKDHALNLIQNFEALKQYTIRRIVEDNNLLSPSVN